MDIRTYYRFRGLQLIQGVLGGVRPAVMAMIASAALPLITLSFFGQRSVEALDPAGVSWIAVGILATSLFVLRRWHVNPLYVMAGAAVAGVILYSIFPTSP